MSISGLQYSLYHADSTTSPELTCTNGSLVSHEHYSDLHCMHHLAAWKEILSLLIFDSNSGMFLRSKHKLSQSPAPADPHIQQIYEGDDWCTHRCNLGSGSHCNVQLVLYAVLGGCGLVRHCHILAPPWQRRSWRANTLVQRGGEGSCCSPCLHKQVLMVFKVVEPTRNILSGDKETAKSAVHSKRSSPLVDSLCMSI